MHRRLAVVPLVLLALAGCGTPDGTLTLHQPQATPHTVATLGQSSTHPVAKCLNPLDDASYPGPGTTMPVMPTATPIIDRQALPEQVAPLGLGSAPRITDQAAALGAFTVMPRSIGEYALNTDVTGPEMMEQDGMLLGYGQPPEHSGSNTIEFAAWRSSPWAMTRDTGIVADWPFTYRDGPILWAESYVEDKYRNEHGEVVCTPKLGFFWALEGSDVLYIIATDSVERRDLVLRAYLEALKSAPPMRELAPLPPPAPEPSFDPSWTPTPTTTPTPAVLPTPGEVPTSLTSPYPAPFSP